MANNVATFIVDVVTKGLKQAQTQVKSMGTDARNAANAFHAANNASGGFYNTQAKGVIGTANSTKSFSKLAETMNSSSGIVGAYATLAANIFAVSAAFNALRGAAQVQQLEQGLTAMSNRMGTTLSLAAASVREISGYTLTTEQALRSTAQIASAGFGTKTMQDLAKVANDASVALGRNMTDSMDRLTRGVVKLEPELLDELGLMTKLGESSANYARVLGKNETQLSNFEKRQGFLNAIVAEGTLKFGGLGDAANQTRNLDRLGATFADLTRGILNFINGGALPLAGLFSNKGILLGGMILFASTISKQLLPGLSNLAVKAARASQELANTAKNSFQAIPTASTEPRAVKGLRRAIDEDRANPESYNKALNAIGMAEQKLDAEIAKGYSNRKAYSKMSVAQLQDEVHILQSQKKLITESMNLQAQAAAKAMGANSIMLAGQGKLIASYILLARSVRAYRDALDQTAASSGKLGAVTGIMNSIRAGFFAAAIGARALGAAVLSALNVIGLIIAAASVLYGAFTWLKEMWDGPAVKKFNEALDEQNTILEQLGDRTSEIARVRASALPIQQREQAIYKVMTNTIRENVEAYEKVKIAQDAAFADRPKVAIGETAEYKTLQNLRKLGAPEVRKQIDDALGKNGLTGVLDDVNKEVDKGTLEKLSKIISGDLRTGAVTLGDHITDLADAFKNADNAVADFNRSMIPSTPYDNVVTQLDAVAAAMENISVTAANSDDYIARMAHALQATGPAMQKFYTPETQGLLNAFATLDAEMKKAGDRVRPIDEQRKQRLTEVIALRSSEVYEVQELFRTGQQVARQIEGQIKMEQVRLDKLNSYTALTGSSIRERRAAENNILQLQARQIEAQENIVKRQMQMSQIQLDMNKTLLTTNSLYLQIAASIGKGAELSQAQLMGELNQRLMTLQKEREEVRAGRGNRTEAQIQADVDQITALAGQYQAVRGIQLQIQASQDQIASMDNERTAILAKQTSATIVNAEANATNAQTAAGNAQKQLEYTQQLVKNAQILSNIEVKRRGYARNTAEEYAYMVNEQNKTANLQKQSIAQQANAEVQQMRVEQARAAGNAAEVAAYQTRIDMTIQLANAKMTEIDRQNQLNILDKFSFDIHKEGLEMQKSSLDYLSKSIDAQSEYVTLQREGRNLTAEIARRRAGRASNEFTQKSEAIADARAQLNLAQQQASMRKAVINLEYALLEAQRQQTIWNLQAQRVILKDNQEQVNQLDVVLRNLEEGASAVKQGQAAALNSVDANISNLAKKLEILGLGEGRNYIGSSLTDYVKLRQQQNAIGTPSKSVGSATPMDTYVAALTKANDPIVTSNNANTEATNNLTAQLRAAANTPIPQVARVVTTLQDAAKQATAAGLHVQEMAGYGGVHAGAHRGLGHIQGRAFDASIASGNQDSTNPRYKAQMDALAQKFVQQGLIVLWNGQRLTSGGNRALTAREGMHRDHMHVEVPAGAARVVGTAVGQAITPPLIAATEPAVNAAVAAGEAAQSAANDNTAQNVTVTAPSRAAAEPPRTPRDLQSLGGYFSNLTQVGDGNMLQTFTDMADKLGPQGQIVPQIIQGISNVTDAYSNFQNVMNYRDENGKGSSFGSKFAAGAAVMQQALGTIQGILTAASDAKIANIDREIAAEQRRDGKSAESVAKIQAMERRKDAIQRKAFNTNKKLMMAQAVIATAAGIAQALTLGPIVGPIMAAVIGALGAAQLAIIAGTSYQSTANANFDQKSMPSTLTIGKRGDGVDLARNNPNVGGELGYLRGTQGTGSNSSNYRPIGSAYGGPLPRGYGHSSFVVGEKGPEVIERDTPMTVRPLDQSNDNRPISAQFTIHALDGESVKQLLDERKGDIIDMLRGAANANGTTFLESVNTSHLKKANGSRGSRI